MEQTLLTAKEQLRNRVTENMKHEQTIAKLQADNLSIREQNVLHEQETEELKQLMDRLDQ